MILITRRLKDYELDEIFIWCQKNSITFTPNSFGEPYCLLLTIDDSKLITYAALKWSCKKFEYPVWGKQ